MKILIRKSDSVVIWGTDNNAIVVEVIDNGLYIDGQLIATNVNEQNFQLIEEDGVNLINPFFIGYTNYQNGFNYTNEYIFWNNKTHNCLLELTFQYEAKSEDILYTDEERIAFSEYVTALNYAFELQYLQPTFSYPTPPDEQFPFVPTCSI